MGADAWVACVGVLDVEGGAQKRNLEGGFGFPGLQGEKKKKPPVSGYGAGILLNCD